MCLTLTTHPETRSLFMSKRKHTCTLVHHTNIYSLAFYTNELFHVTIYHGNLFHNLYLQSFLILFLKKNNGTVLHSMEDEPKTLSSCYMKHEPFPSFYTLLSPLISNCTVLFFLCKNQKFEVHANWYSVNVC